MNNEITPLPKRQFLILLIVRFSEPVAFTLLFPFVYFMVKDFHFTDDSKEIGYYVGYIASTFAISQLMTSIFWGRLSDKIGRRPVIVMGLLGSSLSLLMFGLSKSLWWALISRALCGLLNGNIGVVKSMVTELTDPTNRALGFSYLPMVFCIGSIFGPLLGGYLSNPVEKYPLLFRESWLFSEFPYLLPCLVSSLMCLSGAIFAFLYLEETLNKEAQTNEEDQGLIAKNFSRHNYSTLPNDEELDDNQDSLKISRKDRVVNVFNQISHKSWFVLFGALLLSFLTTFSDELLPLWAASPQKVGGLGFSTTLIGNLMSITGISGMILQFILYPRLQRRYGTIRIYKFGCFLFVPLFLCYPLTSDWFRNDKVWLWPFLLGLSIFRMAYGIFCYTGINIMISETSSRKILGTVNGIDVSMRALSRTIAPIVCGILWSWSLTNQLGFPFDYYFAWYFCAFISLCNFFLARIINSRLQT